MESIPRPSPLPGLRTAAASVLSLWTIDVLVNLALVEKLLGGTTPHARPIDFLGLLLAGLPVSLGVILASPFMAIILARFALRVDPRREAAALLVAALTACAVFVPLAWTPSRAVVFSAVLSSVLAGAGVWYRLRAPGRRPEPAGEWRRCGDIILLPLVAGLLAAAVAGLLRGDRPAALMNGLLCLGAAGLYLGALASGGLLRPAALASIPPLAAIVCGALACIDTSRYGEPGPSTPAPVADARPDIVLVMLDTVRADRLKRYGYSRDTMPALDAWAEGAFVFRRAVSTAGWTAPAHASIFSGLVVSRHGVHYADGEGDASPLSSPPVEGVSWLPARLGEAGYYGIAVTANELALPDGMTGFARVLAPSRSTWSRLTLGSLADRLFPPSGRLSERLGWRLPYVDAGGIIDLAMRALPAESGPVFLFVNILDAHSPYNPPEEALDRLGLEPGRPFSRYERHRQITRRWGSLPEGKLESLGDLYDGELRWIDMNLEKFFPWIERRLGPDTVVVVTSDHGEELGEEGRVGHEFGLAQRLIHVPLFVKGPGLPSSASEAVVSLRSLFRFLDAIGAGAAPDLNHLVETDEPGVLSERYPSGHNRRVLGPDYGRPWVSLIEDDLKGVGPSSADWVLYDLSSSGFEGEMPVAGDPRAEALRERIDSFWEQHQDRRDLNDGDLSEDELRRLRSLGYVK